MSEKPHFSMKDTTLTVMLGVGFSLLVAVALIPSKPIDNIERPRHLTADIPQEYQDFTKQVTIAIRGSDKDLIVRSLADPRLVNYPVKARLLLTIKLYELDPIPKNANLLIVTAREADQQHVKHGSLSQSDLLALDQAKQILQTFEKLLMENAPQKTTQPTPPVSPLH